MYPTEVMAYVTRRQVQERPLSVIATVLAIIIYNSQALRMVETPLKRRMEGCAHTIERYVKIIIATHNNVDETHRHYIEWMKADTKEHILYDSIYVNCKDRQNESMQDRCQSSDCFWVGHIDWAAAWTNIMGTVSCCGWYLYTHAQAHTHDVFLCEVDWCRYRYISNHLTWVHYTFFTFSVFYLYKLANMKGREEGGR